MLFTIRRVMLSASARRLLDVEELASRRAVIAGLVEAESMPRLLDVVSKTPRAVAYRIEFTRDTSRRPKMIGRVDGMLPLVCQRCLGSLDWRFDMKFESLLVANDREEANVQDAVVCSGGRIALEPMIEDELLLAMPNAPVHPHGACEAPPIRVTNDCSSSTRFKPFSALRALQVRRRGEQSN